MKKLISILLTVSMITAILVTAVFAGNQVCGDFEYAVLADNTAQITKYKGSDRAVVIPESVDGHKVTSLTRSTFFMNNKVKEITLPDSLREIGESVFCNLYALEKVRLGRNIESIGQSAFMDCLSLKEVTGESRIESIGKNAFFECSSLERIDLPDTVKTIGEYAFGYCENLKNVNFGNSLETISYGAFDGCSSLVGIHLPSTVSVIRDYAFTGCKSVDEIKVDTGNKKFRSKGNCLIDINSATLIAVGKEYEIPSDGSVKTIGKYAFHSGCDSSNIIIPEGITTIDSHAFGAIEVKVIFLPKTLECVKEEAFGDCEFNDQEPIETVYYNGTKEMWDKVDIAETCEMAVGDMGSVSLASNLPLTNAKEIVFFVPKKVLKASLNDFEYTVLDDGTASICAYTGGDKNVIVPQEIGGKKITGIYVGAFRDNDRIEKVTLPDTVTAIYTSAFENCTALEEVDFGKSLVRIEDMAFMNCTSLKEVVLPDTVQTILPNAFAGCGILSSIKLGRNLKTIGVKAFTGTAITSMTLPASVTYFANPFAGCKSLKEISVEEGNEKFFSVNNCIIEKSSGTLFTALADSVIPANGTVKTIGAESFACMDITDVVIPEGVTEICDDAFCDCDSIKTVRLPRTLEKMGKYVFCSTNPVDTLIYNGSETMWEKRGFTRTFKEVDGDTGAYDVTANKALENAEHKIFEGTGYSDVSEKAWYKASADYVTENFIMFGTSSDCFSPNSKMTRSMLATVLWRMDGKKSSTTKAPFTDLKADWYVDAVKWAFDKKIVNGTSETKFSPNGSITREQLATMLYRYAEYKKLDTSKQAELTKFADAKKVSSYAETAVKWAVAEGIIGGTEKNGKAYLDPQGNATRAQVATMLQRFCDD